MKGIENITLPRVGELRMGETIIEKDCTGEGLPIYSADKSNRPWAYSTHFKRLNQYGTIVLGARGTIGYPRLPKEAVFGATQTTITLWPDSEKFVPEFVYYALQQLDFSLLGAQQAIPMLTVGNLEAVSIPRYPKLEQSKIAEILSKVDQAIEQTESLIAKQQRIKTGLMQDLLTRGIDEHGNLRSEETHEFKDSPLGRIPVEWELFTVDSLGEVVTGSTPNTSVENYYDGDIMFVSPKDISNTSELITQTEKTLSPSGLSVCRAIPMNSICTVCIGSTIGKIGLTKSQCATNQQINTLIPYISEDAEMLLFAMRLFLRPQLRREAGLQAVPIVNKALFSKMILPFSADPDEKTRARTVLSAASSQIDAQIAYSEKLRSLKTALMQDLLTGKKRVTPLMENMEVHS